MAAAVILGPDDHDESGWVEAHSIAEIEEFVRAGRTVAVTPAALAGDDDEAAELTAASICAWAGRARLPHRPPRPVTARGRDDRLPGGAAPAR